MKVVGSPRQKGRPWGEASKPQGHPALRRVTLTRRGPCHPPAGCIWRKGVCSEPAEQTSQDDNQIILENEMRRGVRTKAHEKKNKAKVAEIGALNSKAFLAPSRV